MTEPGFEDRLLDPRVHMSESHTVKKHARTQTRTQMAVSAMSRGLQRGADVCSAQPGKVGEHPLLTPKDTLRFTGPWLYLTMSVSVQCCVVKVGGSVVPTPQRNMPLLIHTTRGTVNTSSTPRRLFHQIC